MPAILSGFDTANLTIQLVPSNFDLRSIFSRNILFRTRTTQKSEEELVQTSFSSSEVMHLSAWAGFAMTMVVVSPNDSVLRVTFGDVLAGEAGADA